MQVVPPLGGRAKALGPQGIDQRLPLPLDGLLRAHNIDGLPIAPRCPFALHAGGVAR